MKTTKPCKICSNYMPKWLNNTCSPKCEKEKQKRKRIQVKEQKKMSISSLSKVADTLWSKVIRKDWYCDYCGSKDNLNAHHIFSRHNKSVRWECSNWIPLCSKCHVFSDEFSAHKTPTEFTIYLQKQLPKWHLDKLQELAHIPLHVTPEYLQEKIRIFKLILEENENKI